MNDELFRIRFITCIYKLKRNACVCMYLYYSNCDIKYHSYRPQLKGSLGESFSKSSNTMMNITETLWS